MRVRPAADEDLPAIAAIAAANDDSAGADPRYVSHLRDNGRFLVAEAGAAEIDLTDRDRTPDYAYWATKPDATGLAVRDGGTVVAVGVVGRDQVHHLVTADDHDPVATLTAALGALDAGRVSVCLPGPHPALPALLEARWRIEDVDQHLSSRPDLLSVGSVLSPSLA